MKFSTQIFQNTIFNVATIKCTMKLLTYFSSLILSGYIYLLFASYMTASASLSSIFPLISFYCAIIIFGLFSWLHFYKPRAGIILLSVFSGIMYFSWPFILSMEHYLAKGNGYKSDFYGTDFPFILCILTLFFGWFGYRYHFELKKYVKLVLAIPPTLLALYIGGYFTIYMFLLK